MSEAFRSSLDGAPSSGAQLNVARLIGLWPERTMLKSRSI
jgi:hypothetical protein